MFHRSYLVVLLCVGLLSGEFVNGGLVTCPHEPTVLSCTTASFHTWSGSAFDCPGVDPKDAITVFTFDPLNMNYTCGKFRASLTDKGASMITSQLEFTAVPALDGTRITCVGSLTEGTVYNETIKVNTHAITDVDASDVCVELQVSTIDDPSQCYKEFIFSANGTSETDSVTPSSSTTFTGEICGLCALYCDYSYTVEGFPVYGESMNVSTTTNADSDCPQKEEVQVTGRSITLFLSDEIDDSDSCTSVEPTGLSHSINESDSSITWVNFMYCQDYDFVVHFTCCPESVMHSHREDFDLPKPALDIRYYCIQNVVNVSAEVDVDDATVVVTVVDSSGLALDDPSNISMINNETYTANGMALLDSCSNSSQEIFVPNIILDHEVTFPSDITANVSVTTAPCVDSTSNFKITLTYTRVQSTTSGRRKKNVHFYGHSHTIRADPDAGPVTKPYDQPWFLIEVIPEESYRYTIEVTNDGVRIGKPVDGDAFIVPKQSRGLSGGAIAGIVVGVFAIAIGIVFIVVGIALLCHYCKKKGTKRGCLCSSGEGGNTTGKGMELKESSDTDVGHSKTPWWKCCI